VFAVSFLLLWVPEAVGSKLRNRIEEVHEDFGVILTATLIVTGPGFGIYILHGGKPLRSEKAIRSGEANAIGTEYLRLELLPASDDENLRVLLREYLDQRILFYQTRDRERLQRIDDATAQLQSKLRASIRSRSLSHQTMMTSLAVSGMNNVLDSRGYTQAAWRNRIPLAAWTLMGLIAISGNLMVGLYLRRLPMRNPACHTEVHGPERATQK
jgi:hypothetical protein